MTAIDLSKQQALDADKKEIQQINFTGYLARNPVANRTIFSIIIEAKEIILDFSHGTVKVLRIYFILIWYQYKIIQYNNLNVKLPNSQINKLKSGIEKGTEMTLKLTSNVVSDSNDENNFLHKLLLIYN